MKSIITKLGLVILGLLFFNTAIGQINMNRYITLNVQQGQWIRLNLATDTENTSVKVVSGTYDTTLTVGTALTGRKYYYAQAGIMTIYGNVKIFSCYGNTINITGINVSHNSELIELYCNNNSINSLNINNLLQLQVLYLGHNNILSLDISNNIYLNRLSIAANPFSTATIDSIYCKLNDRTNANFGVIWAADTITDANISNILATNANNAISKNWYVSYGNNGYQIPTIGNATCGNTPPQPVNMNRYITLNVTPGDSIEMYFFTDNPTMQVRIESGIEITTTTSNWITSKKYRAGSNIMKIYGNIKWFDCKNNINKISNIDFTNNSELTKLYCNNNNLNSLNVNNLSQLKALYCINASLTSLDISNNCMLEKLYCAYNNLTTLDISNNLHLDRLYIANNSFSTNVIDNIYCQLNDRTGISNGIIWAADSISDNSIVLATNANNAISKNWSVEYGNIDATIQTTGTYSCPIYYSINFTSSLNGTLSVTSGGSNITSGTVLTHGTSITITATPNANYELDSIKVNGVAYTSSPQTITLTEDILISATFKLKKYTITYADAVNGTLSVMNGTTNIVSGTALTHGTSITITAIPDANYELDSIKVNGVAYTSSPQTITLTEDILISAIFKLKTGLREIENLIINAKLYPNPASKSLYIEADQNIQRVELFDILGKKVLSKEPKQNSFSIDVSSLEQGVYILKLSSDKGTGEYKVVKE